MKNTYGPPFSARGHQKSSSTVYEVLACIKVQALAAGSEAGNLSRFNQNLTKLMK